MKPGRFEYLRPRSLEEAVELKSVYGADSSILAGGQSLIPVLNFRLGRPRALIDLSATEASGIDSCNGHIEIKAMTRQRHVEKSPLVMRTCPLLVEALGQVAHPAVRNRGTVCGSVAHADPSAEIPSVLAALDGVVIAQSVRGNREIAARDFFSFGLTNTLAEDELVSAVRFPAAGEDESAGFFEYGRRHGDFALAGVGVSMRVAESGNVSRVRIGLCGVAPTPVRAESAERLLIGTRGEGSILEAAAAQAVALVDVTDEPQASASYRRDLVHGLTMHAIQSVLGKGRCT